MFSTEWVRRIAAVMLVVCTVSAVALDEEDDDDEDDEDSVTLSTGAASGSVETEVDEPLQQFGGWIDLRPSFSVNDEAFHAENETALSWAFSDNRTLGYTQEWTAGSFRSPQATGDSEMPSGLGEGYLWGMFDNIWTANRGNIRLSYEPRLYFPTSSLDRQAGLVTYTRQIVKLDVRVAPQAEFFLWESPILALYSQSGYENDNGTYANRYFENRLEFGIRATFWNERITATLRGVLQSRRFVDFEEDAENNNEWSHIFYVYPEITVKVAPKTSLGAAFYSDSLIGNEGLGNSFRQGVAQMVLTQEI